jgi:hypothetical protein
LRVPEGFDDKGSLKYWRFLCFEKKLVSKYWRNSSFSMLPDIAFLVAKESQRRKISN